MENKAVHALVSGRVQGVFFRLSTQEEARRIGVFGWVRNMADGRVEAVIEGPAPKVDQMVDWLWKGSANARVEDVQVTQQPFEGRFHGFEVTR